MTGGIAGWLKRRIWRGLRRYTLHGPSEGMVHDGEVRWFAERYILERRGVATRFAIDVAWLRMVADPGQARRREIATHAAGLEAWRKEHPGSHIVRDPGWHEWEGK